jgi:hypothetical protein
MRFSLKLLLTAVAFMALSCVALLNANQPWVLVARNLVRLTVVVAIVGTVWCIGKERAWWSGYGVFIVVYINSGFGFLWVEESLTYKAFSYIHPHIASQVTETFSDPSASDSRSVLSRQENPDGSLAVTYLKPMEERFIRVGDAICAVLSGVLGGFIAVAFYRRRPKRVEA